MGTAFTILANPLTSALLATLLVIDAKSLPVWQYQGGRSTVGAILAGESDNPTWFGEMCATAFPTGLVRVRGDDVRLVTTWGPDTQQDAYEHEDLHARFVLPLPRTIRSGLWAVTESQTTHTVRATYGASLTDDQRARARAAFVDALPPWELLDLSPEDRSRLRHADVVSRSPIRRGYAHDLIAGALAIAFVCSLTWVPPAPSALRSLQAARRRSRGLCHACAYNRAGLSPETPCPECGTTQYPSPCDDA